MKIGIFYQSGNNYVACYKSLEQLRKYYPVIPISLYEDNSHFLEEVSNKFNCQYTHIGSCGFSGSSKTYGRVYKPNGDIQEAYKWVTRIYQALNSTLKDVDWIIHYEDDVWCKNIITKLPAMDLMGANGPLYTKELYNYLKNKFNIKDESRNHWSSNGSLESYGACGGTIFSRIAFLKCYENFWNIPWDEIYKLDNRVVEYCDAHLSFIFQWNGYKTGVWNDWSQYDAKNIGNWWDKTGWTVPMEEQSDVAFIHGYKHYYNYSKEDICIID